MESATLVKNFLSTPYQLSALGGTDEVSITGKVTKVSHYYDYLALFHIILVKKEEKKGFVIPIVRNGAKICQKLKLPHERVHGKLVRVASKDNKIPENITKEIINLGAKEKFEKHIICSNDLASCDGLIVEDVEEYPVCCVNSFNENKWNDLTIAMDYFRSKKMIVPLQQIVGKIIEKSEDGYLNETMFNARQSIMMEYIQTREKYPFVFHQACSNCLSDSNSPSAKLNSRWSKLCQEEFPDLYREIKKGARQEAKKKTRRWSKTWEQHLDAKGSWVPG